MKTNLQRFLTPMICAGFILCAFLIAQVQQPLLTPTYLVGLLAALFAFYILLIHTKMSLTWILGLSIIVQIIFLFMPAFFNDFWRYLWDGKMSLHSINPYALFPWAIHDNPVTAHLAAVPYWNDMFFKWTHTSYGPTLQIVFWFSNVLREDSALVLKALFFLFNLGSLGLGIKILDALKKDRRLITLLALNPLFLFETLATAHTEAVFIFFLLLTLYLFITHRRVRAGMSFGALIATKFFPILIAPLFILGKNIWLKKGWWKITLSTIISVIVLYIPFSLGIDLSLLFESFSDFSNEWIMSPGIFDVVHTFFSSLTVREPLRLTKLILNGLTILGAMLVYLQYRKKQNIFEATHWIFLLLIVFSSVVFSWYILWLVALLPFIQKKWPTIVLSGTMLLQYLLIYFDSTEHNTFKYTNNGDILWHQLLIWLPFFIALLLSMRKEKNKQVVAFYARIPDENLVGKTRVGKAIGNLEAGNELARALILDMLDAYVPQFDDAYNLVFFHKGAVGDFSHPQVKQYIQQPDDTLPNNMNFIHRHLAQTYERVLIVGSDIPLISHNILTESFNKLSVHDVVVGPVEDGGYGLIGSRGDIDLYTPISNWESRSPGYDLFNETKKLAEKRGLALFAHKKVFDIDTPEDLKTLWSIIAKDDVLKSEYAYLQRTFGWLAKYKKAWQ